MADVLTCEEEEDDVDDGEDLLGRQLAVGELLQRDDERHERVEDEGDDQQALDPRAMVAERHQAQQVGLVADQDVDGRQRLPVRSHRLGRVDSRPRKEKKRNGKAAKSVSARGIRASMDCACSE